MTVLAPMLVLLALFVLGLALVGRWLECGTLGRDRPPRTPATPAEPPRRPVEVVGADLRRLYRQLALVPAGAPLVRWQALWTAYDAVLVEAAEQLEVPHELAATCPGLARDIERVRLLAALEGAGLAVRG